jgi:hypothetical protein
MNELAQRANARVRQETEMVCRTLWYLPKQWYEAMVHDYSRAVGPRKTKV